MKTIRWSLILVGVLVGMAILGLGRSGSIRGVCSRVNCLPETRFLSQRENGGRATHRPGLEPVCD